MASYDQASNRWAGVGRTASAVAALAVPAPQRTPSTRGVAAHVELKGKLESSQSYCSFKCLIPGGFNVGVIGSTCTALPRPRALAVAAQVEIESKILKRIMIEWLQALSSRRFQRGFHWVKLHRPTWLRRRTTSPRCSSAS